MMNSLFFCGGAETRMINTARINSAILKLLVVLLFTSVLYNFSNNQRVMDHCPHGLPK